MRKTANDESGVFNLSSVDFAKNFAYSDLTVGLELFVSNNHETQTWVFTNRWKGLK